MSGAVKVTQLGSALAAVFSAHAVVNAFVLRRPRAIVATQHERVRLLIPARDEAERIGPCLEAALAQTGFVDLEIVVLDDGSTDATKNVVERLILEHAAGSPGPSLRLVDGGDAPLPEGWLGKPWACERLRLAVDGDVLVYIDADVHLQPRALASSVALLRESGTTARGRMAMLLVLAEERLVGASIARGRVSRWRFVVRYPSSP